MDNKSKLISVITLAVLVLNGFIIWRTAQDSPLLMVALAGCGLGCLLMLWNFSLKLFSENSVRDFLTQHLAHTAQILQSHRDVKKQDSSGGPFSEMEALLNDFKYRLSTQLRQLSDKCQSLESKSNSQLAALSNSQDKVMLVNVNGKIEMASEGLSQSLQQYAGNEANAYSVGSTLPNDVFSGLTNDGHHSLEIQGNEITLDVRSHQSDCYVIGWTDVSEDLKKSALGEESVRKNQALESVTTHVMLADADYNIVYMNPSLVSMLQANEDTFKETFSGFDVSALIGANIDVFHKDPSHQRGLLDNLTSTYESEISVQDLTFGLTVNPIVDEQQNRIGTVVEWSDLTAVKEAAAQQQQNARMKVALDNVTTNVMMADNDCNIIYLNESLKAMMQANLEKFRTLRADFDPSKLVGVNIDVFHKNPAHQRQLLNTLSDTYRTEIKLEDLVFALTANPVMDDHGNRLGTTLEWTDITEQKRAELVAMANARIKVALDSVTTNVMVADHDYNVVYMNETMHAMMKNAEKDLQKELKDFDASDILGKNIDIFHKNPAHQRQMLDRLTDTYRTKIVVGGRHFNLIATPVVENGQRLGVVVEWDDTTAQFIVQQEVEKLVSNVGQGKLGALISTDDKEGFYLTLSEGLNAISQTVNGFVNDIAAALQKLSQGDLKVRITNDYQGMYLDIRDSLNRTVEKLNEVVTNIQENTEAIRSSNSEISQGNDQLSSRTERQASSLEETAASLEQLTANVKQTAENSRTADQSSAGVKSQAQSGADIVKEAMVSMGAITESSNRIVEIISVIDEIAFQTNLLALNASVEAARAGEQGRGFAVVANEVRNLAQRSAVSAKEIKELIDDSSERVASGSQLVNRCGESLTDILKHVEELSGLIAGIASATNEQAMGISEVNQAMTELDDITQQNAALSEEVSSASTSSLSQVNDMVEIVSFFDVDNSNNPFAKAPAKSAKSDTSKPAAEPAKPAAAKPRVTTKPAPAKAPPPKQAPAPTSGATVKPVDIDSDGDSDDEWEEF